MQSLGLTQAGRAWCAFLCALHVRRQGALPACCLVMQISGMKAASESRKTAVAEAKRVLADVQKSLDKDKGLWE